MKAQGWTPLPLFFVRKCQHPLFVCKLSKSTCVPTATPWRANHPRFISRIYRALDAEQWKSSDKGSMSASIITAPASSRNAALSGNGVSFIHTQRNASAGSTNSMPAFSGSEARPCSPRSSVSVVAAISTVIFWPPSDKVITGKSPPAIAVAIQTALASPASSRASQTATY